MMDALSCRLLDRYQRDFPLVPQPYQVLAEELGVSDLLVRQRLARLQQQGAISRVGAVFRPHTVGSSTLAAMMVPAARLEAVADIVSGFAQVNHNYQRDHAFNLWFVVCAQDHAAVQRVLAAIETATGLAILDLPMIEDFHIDLGFPLWGPRKEPCRPKSKQVWSAEPDDLTLIGSLAEGLSFSARPFGELGLEEGNALSRLHGMVESGVIRRFGVIVRHHELGFGANAMAVWDIPDDLVSEIGRRLGDSPEVSLCYRRPRRLPDWPYSLFCMVHGREPSVVSETIRALIVRHGLEGFGHTVLFSRRRFKQRGAIYGKVA